MNDNKNIENDSQIMNSSTAQRGSILDKLKPSLKNKMITKKFGNLLGNSPISTLNGNNIKEFDIIQNDFILLRANDSERKGNDDSYNKNNSNIYQNNINNNVNNVNFNNTNSPFTTNNMNPNINYNILNNSIINSQIQNKGSGNYNFYNNNNIKFDKMIQNTSELRNSTATIQTNPNQVSNTSIKWSNMVKKSKQEVLKLDLSQSEVLSSTNQLDFSAMSENMDDLNDIIEENYQVVITENSFLRQESHSILPFLFLTSREIHRMCLSDYEIKLVNKSIKNKIKNNRLDWMDYYKKGLIKFYQAKYFDSYMNFKAAHNMRNKDKEIAKWLAFNTLIIIFCTNNENNENSKFNINDFTNNFLNFNLGGNSFDKNGFSNNNSNLNNSNFSNGLFGSFKIDFSQMEKLNIKNEEYDYSRSTNINENVSDEEENALFSCCNARKTKMKSITVSALVNNYQPEKEQYKYNKSQLCKDLENLLNDILDRTSNLNSSENNDLYCKENNYLIEIWWMFMIISVYVKLKPDQKAFSKSFDPKHCVKKIKDKDVYLGYLAYAEYNCLINKSFNPENIYVEIIYKYPKRIEAYLKFWNRLVKGNSREYKKAHSLSEVFWKNSSIIQFDNDVY